MFWSKFLKRLLLSIWLLLLLLIAGSRFFASMSRFIDLTACSSHFILLPALITLVVSIIFWFARRHDKNLVWYWLSVLISTLTILIICVPFLAFLPVNTDDADRSKSPAAAVNDSSVDVGRDIRILVVNIQSRAEALENLLPVLEREQVDVVLILEIGLHLAQPYVQREDIESRYPFVEVARREINWQMIIMSRWPMHWIEFEAANTGSFEKYKHLFAYRRSQFIDSPQGRFLFTGIHAASPRTSETWVMGNYAVELLTECSRQFLLSTDVPVVVGGDFNSTLNGYRYRMMQNGSGLYCADTFLYGGINGSWPAHFPGPLRLMLDHVWGSAGVDFRSCRVLEDIGSDHRPILVTFQLNR